MVPKSAILKPLGSEQAIVRVHFSSVMDRKRRFCFGSYLIPDGLPVGEVDLNLTLQGRRDDLPELGILRGERLEVGASAVRVPWMQERVQGHVLDEKRSPHLQQSAVQQQHLLLALSVRGKLLCLLFVRGPI